MRTWPALCLSGLDAPSDNPECPLTELVYAALCDHPVAAIEEVSADEWRIFFSSPDERRTAADAVSRLLPSVSVSTADVGDGDWAARSQASLRAVAVGGVVVAPPWDATAGDGTLIVIQPSMGFGTGHHATTRLCLAALQRVVLTGVRLIDVGTGSGVLALAASLLGASEAVGIDDDPDAVQAASENLALNPTARVRFLVEDLRTYPGSGFDLVTANLTGGLLASASTRLQRLVRPGGTLILSGLMSGEAASVLPHFEACETTDLAEEDEWLCVTLVRRS
jgi:ribosomal protein L11 methyltransferase